MECDHTLIHRILVTLGEHFPNGLAFFNQNVQAFSTRDLSLATVYAMTGRHPPPAR